jgi:hypothetical protein
VEGSCVGARRHHSSAGPTPPGPLRC